MSRRLLAVLLVLPLASAGPTRQQTTEFARLIERLSEDDGFFNSDNLVSNETSYLHVLGGFRALGVRGGAYLGVGPEQGYAYIAEIAPEIAFVIDIRRDNMLLHLLFKAMFATARNRMEYLCLLYGRPPPRDLPMWTELDLAALLDYLDRTPMAPAAHDRNHRQLMTRVARFGVALTREDRETLRRFHDEFAIEGLDLRYSSRGRPPRFSMPTVRRLYLETDLEGSEASYLATEDRWRVVRTLHRRDRIVPVVGDLAGPKAVKAIAAYLQATNRSVSVFYLSNVESYLFRYGTFQAFVANLRALPAGRASVLVRSWFGRGAMLPGSVPGHYSTQQLQTFERFLALTANPDSVRYRMLLDDSVDWGAPALVTPGPPRRR